MKISQNQKGFGVVEVIVIIVVLALIVVGGWYVWQAQNRPTGQQPSANTPSATNNNTAVDPYEGWKLYCDEVRKACFKYPADWTLDTQDVDGAVSVSVLNPAKTIVATYNSEDTRDGATMPYYVADIEATADNDYKVLGGFVAPATSAIFTPEYKVVDASFVVGAAEGQEAMITNTARFTRPDGRNGSFRVYPASASEKSRDDAKTWFQSDDAKAGLLVADSFYFKQ